MELLAPWGLFSLVRSILVEVPGVLWAKLVSALG